ncbi:hypothetical protein DPV78_006073 [Talaromyces pinophilus]|nr:hypothetical protein DPV78_006073 [Talaromyces pinophilus]
MEDGYPVLSMYLPTLTNTPSRHPDCCISLSSTLLRTITASLCESTQSGLVLSVGSGTGLLEALLYSMWTSSSTSQTTNLLIEGVEVIGPATSTFHSPNKYLPEQCFDTVKGTWVVSSRVKQAIALMFVYPRSTELVRFYIQEAGLFSGPLHVVLWLGPNCDWAEFKPCFTDNGWVPVQIIGGNEAGLAEYELMAIIKRF